MSYRRQKIFMLKIKDLRSLFRDAESNLPQ